MYVDAMLTVLKYFLSDRHDAWEMNKLRTCVSQISTLESPKLDNCHRAAG